MLVSQEPISHGVPPTALVSCEECSPGAHMEQNAELNVLKAI